MFTTAARTERDLGVPSISLNTLTGHRSGPRRIAAGYSSSRRRGSTGYGRLSGGRLVAPSGDWDSGNPAFAISRGFPSAPSLTPEPGRWFPDMLFSLAPFRIPVSH